ncbi:MAG: FAD-binding oxidoreductase [Pseudomonadota bacterium]
MDRRTLIKSLLATTLVGCEQRHAPGSPLRVVVAGAGIIGASVAYHLAKAGADVTVIDQQGPATHASRGTFAWINATWAKQPRHYHALTQASMVHWKQLQEALDIPVRWGGSLEWFDNDERQVRLAEQIAEQLAWGEPARMVQAPELAELEPELSIDPDVRVAYSGNDGAVDPIVATDRLLSAAQQQGAKLRYPCELIDTVSRGTRLVSVETSDGTIAADRLILATGAAPDVCRRFAHIDIPQRTTPGVIAITRPTPRCVHRIIAAPGAHFHQRDDGRIVLGEQDGAPDTEAHALRLKDRPNDFPSDIIAQQHGNRIRDVAAQFVPQIANTEIETAYIGWRPLPLDGHPVLGFSPERPDVYIAIMHSGVSLAPIVGQQVTREVFAGIELEELQPYRPTRSFQQVSRY